MKDILAFATLFGYDVIGATQCHAHKWAVIAHSFDKGEFRVWIHHHADDPHSYGRGFFYGFGASPGVYLRARKSAFEDYLSRLPTV